MGLRCSRIGGFWGGGVGEEGGGGALGKTTWQGAMYLGAVRQLGDGLQDGEESLQVHQGLAHLPVEPAQELQGAPQLQQQPLSHHLQPANTETSTAYRMQACYWPAVDCQQPQGQ